jgi:transposase InsO family protein
VIEIRGPEVWRPRPREVVERQAENKIVSAHVRIQVRTSAWISRVTSSRQRTVCTRTSSLVQPPRGGANNIVGVVFHTDHGSQYTSENFGQLCDDLGVVQSMGATGVCWDNSVAESFFATLKKEMYYRQTWATRPDARRAVIRWIEGWYNPYRMHSTNGYQSPNQKEQPHRNQGKQAA